MTRRDRDERGQVTLLIIGFAGILLMAIVVVIDASAAYLQRMDLHNRSEEVTMFDNFCSVCASRVLIFPSQVTSMANTTEGIVVSFTCWCGTEQTQVTGRKARAAARETVAA